MTPLNPKLRATLAAIVAALALLPAVARAGNSDDERIVRRDARRDVRVIVPETDRRVVLGGRRGFLGVHVAELTPELRRHFHADEDAGVLVSRVEPDSPAAVAGIRVGDVLVAVDGKSVEGALDLREAVAPKRDGDVVGVDLVREGRRLSLDATLQERQGRVLELGSLLQRDGEGRPLIVLPSEGEWEALTEHFEEVSEEIGQALEEAFENPEVRLRLGEQVRERERFERQIELLERRLQELERRLEERRR